MPQIFCRFFILMAALLLARCGVKKPPLGLNIESGPLTELEEGKPKSK